MAQKDLPRKQPRKTADTVLQRFYTSLEHGNLSKARKLLTELEASPPPGLWMHRALGLVLSNKNEKTMAFMNMLFASPHAPKPTSNSDFIRLCGMWGEKVDNEVLYCLLSKGFLPRTRTAQRLLDAVRQGRVDPEKIPATSLRPAGNFSLSHACAMAVLDGAPEAWLETLNAALLPPLPYALITERLVEAMVSPQLNVDAIEQRSLDTARNLWWLDYEIAKNFVQNRYSRAEGATLQRVQHVPSRIAQSAIEEEVKPCTPLSPVRRRF